MVGARGAAVTSRAVTAVLLVLTSVISAYYYLKVVVSMYMWSSERQPIRSNVPAMAAIALLIAVLAGIGVGIGLVGAVGTTR